MPNARSKHPSARELADFGLGKLSRDLADAVAAHLAACGECQEKLTEQQPDSFVARLRAARPRGSTAVPGGRRPPLPGETVRTSPPVRRDTEAARDVPPGLAALSKFQFLEKLGEGGMGAVWKARHAFLGSVVAVKVMNDVALGDDDARHRFLREMRAAGKLDHPNIVRAHDAEQAGELLYLVMEYVEGLSLDKLVGENGPLPIGLACRCAAQAAEGLRHAHEKAMVHRDIKPGNLMVLKDRTVKVLDFGLARLCDDEAGDRRTRLQTFMGTADYVSPEQALNARGADIRSDIYSLGCTLYFLLRGRPPFVGESAHEVAAAHLTEEAAPLDGIPEALWAVIARMMAKDREQRYQTPAEVIEALRPFASRPDSAVVAASPPPLPPPLPPRRGWSRPLVSVGLASAAAVALILSVLLLLPARDRRLSPPLRLGQFVPLFNGRDLDGWETHPDSKAPWEVRDGLLVCEGPGPSFLFTRRDDYENVKLRASVRLRQGGNSGLFVRKPFNPLFQQGYQAEVFTDSNGERRTGGIVVAGAYLALPMDPPPVGDWLDLEFTIDGYRMETAVNGRVTAQALDHARRHPRGRIAIELGQDQSRVEFRKIEVMELPSQPQLLQNPGCEAELVAGKIPGWKVVEGEWTSRAANPAPHEGKAYFFAGECPRAELQQLVGLSRYAREIDDGRLGVTFEGYVATYPQRRSDTSQVIIDYLDAAKESLTSFTSEKVASETGWQKLSDSRVVPRGTRWARVQLISVRHDGKNNDGYFDGLWLKADVMPP